MKAGHSKVIWFLSDALGSVRDIVGSDGAVLQSYDYKENGEKTPADLSGPQSQKTWVGGLSVNDDVGDSGLYLMGHRHHDPSVGRFLSRDPIGFAGGLNLYVYGGNQPTSSVDPSGLLTLVEEAWEVVLHLGDADFIGGQPHGHIKSAPGKALARGEGVPRALRNKPFVGNKVNMVTGEIFSAKPGTAGGYMGKLPQKVMESFVKQEPGLAIRVTEAGVLNYKKMFQTALGRANGLLLFGGLLYSMSTVAQAEPCEQGQVAAVEAGSWALGLGLGAAIQQIPKYGGRINAGLTAAALGWSYGRALGQTTWAGDDLTADEAWQELFYQAFFRP